MSSQIRRSSIGENFEQRGLLISVKMGELDIPMGLNVDESAYSCPQRNFSTSIAFLKLQILSVDISLTWEIRSS